MATTTIVAASLVLGTGLATWQTIRATAAEKHALQESSRADIATAKARLQTKLARRDWFFAEFDDLLTDRLSLELLDLL